MNITTTQPAPCYASLATTSLDITLAATKAKRSASPDGAVRTVTNPSAPTDAFMERASGQVSVSAATATRERDATSAKHTQDAKMASAPNHGSVAATKTGVEYSVTKVSDDQQIQIFDLFFSKHF